MFTVYRVTKGTHANALASIEKYPFASEKTAHNLALTLGNLANAENGRITAVYVRAKNGRINPHANFFADAFRDTLAGARNAYLEQGQAKGNKWHQG